MATYYVDFTNGSDSNNGLGPDASNATNKPWKTISKLLGATGMASGDTGYLAPGTFREVVSVGMTSATAETKIIGDYANTRGFKTSGGVLVPPGPVIHSSHLTNDKTAPSASTVLSTGNRPFLTFQNIFFYGVTVLQSGDSHDLTFTDCAFSGPFTSNNTFISITATTGTAKNLLFDRCHLYNRNGISLTLPTSASADYDSNIVFRNSVIYSISGVAIDITASGALSFKGGGIVIRNCAVYGSNPCIRTQSANISTTIPCKVVNSTVYSAGTPLSANTSGQIIEDYNILWSTGTPRTLVTAGTHTITDTSYANLFHFGQERIWGGATRMFLEPMANSPWIGFGNDSSQTTYDLRNAPRFSTPAVGPLERANTWGQETTTVRTGSNALSCTGSGYQDFLIPVDNTSTTVSVYLRKDSTYAGTAPQLLVLQNDELGLSAQTATHSAAADTWQQVSLTFTASKNGLVTVRLLSNDTGGTGKAFADDFGVT